MEAAGLSLAVFGAADLCLKTGKYLIAKYEDYKYAERDVREIILIFKAVWVKTEIQLESVNEIWDMLDHRLQNLFHELLDLLQSKFEAASAKMDRVMSFSDKDMPIVCSDAKLLVSKHKTMFLKSSIKQAIQDLEDWQRRFDPSWYLITRMANSKIDTYLQRKGSEKSSPAAKLKQIRETMNVDPRAVNGSIFMDGKLIESKRHHLPWSGAYTSRIRDGGGNVLLDTTIHPPDADMSLAASNVRDMARLLSNFDPWEFGLLQCRGVVKLVDENEITTQFQLVFDVPSTLSSPRTLRDVLLQREPHPLNQRFQLAKQLVRSVLFVHTSGFVHKSIRPETIVVYQDEGSVIGPSFLIGFETFRPGAAGTYMRGDLCWEKNLYRHPKRQGLQPEERYVMQHDIYSLGVCLLEIGLWNSFICPDGESMKPGPELNIEDALASNKAASIIKRTLVSMANDRLPSRMGQTYSHLVLSCLSCLDVGDTNLFGKEADLEDDDGIVVGVQYIEKILLQIEKISV